ncbi:hypothetical protein ACFSUD_00445 [Sulfitobacter aestuarii]|uniref:Uncharacterized protein n=1 Tax=Sulfitobacter aestuarii TaxID=2161676 RepID=A0ABW5TXS9_9RHOB
MSSSSVLTLALRALASLTLVLAVVLLPPSSAHAQSGMHEVGMAGDHVVHVGHGMTTEEVTPEHCRADIDADTASFGAPHDADQCCSGICFAAFLEVPDIALLQHANDGHDPSPLAQLAWTVTSGFLRPPNS